MRLFYTISGVLLATAILLGLGRLLPPTLLNLHSNSLINGMLQYQVGAFVLAIVMSMIILKCSPSSRELLRIGDLKTIASRERWLGIHGKSSWAINGLQLLLVISLATGTFMYLGLSYSNSLQNFKLWFIPYVLVFSLFNSLSEELIYRFVIIGNLQAHVAKPTILIVSAVLFGLPHYFGNPSGPVGVLMAGVLGYVLCKASIETKGLGIAWLIHFVQDVIIFTAVLMMSVV